MLILFFSVSASADNSAFSDYDQSLGGYFSALSGIGLSYQSWSGRLGFQTAAGLIYFADDEYYTSPSDTPDPEETELMMYDIGAGIQYMLFENSFSDWLDGCLYLVAGITHFGSVEKTYSYIDTADSEGFYPLDNVSAPRYVPGISTGFGIGIEFLIFDHFSIPVETVLSGSWDTDSRLPIEAGVKVMGGLRYRY